MDYIKTPVYDDFDRLNKAEEDIAFWLDKVSFWLKRENPNAVRLAAKNLGRSGRKLIMYDALVNPK